MPNLINTDYFIGETLLPGASNSVPGGSYSANAVCRAIDVYEPEFMERAFGYEFYQKILTEITVDPEPTIGIWYDIVYGCAFRNHRGVLVKWDGLKNPTNKTSVIADYVYYWFSRNQVTNTAAIGEVKAKAENSTTASAAQKQVSAWNRMSRQLCVLYELLESKDSNGEKVYPEFVYRDTHRFELRPINVFGI